MWMGRTVLLNKSTRVQRFDDLEPGPGSYETYGAAALEHTHGMSWRDARKHATRTPETPPPPGPGEYSVSKTMEIQGGRFSTTTPASLDLYEQRESQSKPGEKCIGIAWKLVSSLERVLFHLLGPGHYLLPGTLQTSGGRVYGQVVLD